MTAYPNIVPNTTTGSQSATMINKVGESSQISIKKISSITNVADEVGYFDENSVVFATDTQLYYVYDGDSWEITNIFPTSSKIVPSVDDENAVKITKADGSTVVASFDTVNGRVAINKESASYPLEVLSDVDDGDTNFIVIMGDEDRTRGFSIDNPDGYKWANYIYEGEDGDAQYFASGNSERDILTMQSGGRVGLNLPTLLGNIEIGSIIQTGTNTYATVTCEVPHRLVNNTPITIAGSAVEKFNGEFVVSSQNTMGFRITGLEAGAATDDPSAAHVVLETTIPAAFAIFPQYFDSIYTFDKALDTGAGTGFTNITANMRTSFGTADIILPPTTGSYLYIGKKYPWRATNFNIETPSNGSSAIVVEYSTELGWNTLSTSTTSGNSLVDGTSRLRNDGNMTWNLKSFKQLWGKQTMQVNGTPAMYTQDLYWIRISLTGTITSTPTAKSIGNHGVDRLALYAQSGDVNPVMVTDASGRFGLLPAELETKYTMGALAGLTTSRFEVIAEDGTRSDFIYYLANNDLAAHPAVVMAKSKGTVGAKLALANGDDVGGVYGYGYDGSQFREIAGVKYEAVGTPSAGSISGRILFITRNTTTASAERARFDELGNFAIGTIDTDGTPATGKITIKGSTNDGTTNVIIGRDSSEVNVFRVDTDGRVSCPVIRPFTDSTSSIQITKADGTTPVVTVDTTNSRLNVTGIAEYADNSAAVTAGLSVGTFYRTGDLLKVVH